MNIVVVGGTGLVGSKVVNRLRDHGVEVRIATRETGANPYTGQGLAESLVGAHVVIDLTNLELVTLRRRTPADFFETCTSNILAGEREAGVGHHVFLSALGAEHIDSHYFRGKAAQARLVRDAPVAHSVLRTTIL